MEYSSQRPSSFPQIGILFRRRRFILLAATLSLALLFFVSWSQPSVFEGLNVLGLPTLSRASIVRLMKSNSAPDEIYGLLHFVTAGDERTLSHSGDFNPTLPVEMAVYLNGDEPNWKTHVKRLEEEYPLIVFSKSYCPYSKKAKTLLQKYNLSPPPKVIEVDLRDDGDFIKMILIRLTNHSTFPNVILQGKSLGGSDDLQKLYTEGLLEGLFEKAGITTIHPASEKVGTN